MLTFKHGTRKLDSQPMYLNLPRMPREVCHEAIPTGPSASACMSAGYAAKISTDPALWHFMAPFIQVKDPTSATFAAGLSPIYPI